MPFACTAWAKLTFDFLLDSNYKRDRLAVQLGNCEGEEGAWISSRRSMTLKPAGGANSFESGWPRTMSETSKFCVPNRGSCPLAYEVDAKLR